MVVSELKQRLHLSCLIGSMTAGVPRSDVYRFEFAIQGVFRADLVVGHSQSRRSVLVEFESGEVNSVFGPQESNQMRAWSRQLERGFGQVIGWAWAIRDAEHTQILKNAFGCDEMSVVYLVVCGRDSLMSRPEKQRFARRSKKILVDG